MKLFSHPNSTLASLALTVCIFGDRFTGHFHQSEALPSPPSSSTSTSTNTSSSSTNGGVPVQVGTWGEREIPGPPAGTPALEYAYWLASPANTTAPTRQEVAEAKRKLARDFTVGVTENMPSFFALVAMKLRKYLTVTEQRSAGFSSLKIE